MALSNQILNFYKNLKPPAFLPSAVRVMNPYSDPIALRLVTRFYEKYYSDNSTRILLIGINPGRFGGGITGIPFTDPIRLEEDCGISNDFEKKPELSSGFIYDMISAFGGPDLFYSKFFVTAVSPLGFTKEGVNINYYDLGSLMEEWTPFMVRCLKTQSEIFGNQSVAFSIGMGKNIKFLNNLNEREGIFKEIRPLPHPRWIMQYRRKRLEEFVGVYLDELR